MIKILDRALLFLYCPYKWGEYLKTKSLSDVVVEWLEEKSHKKVSHDDILYGELVSSLELLELITFIEMDQGVHIQLTHLPPSSFRTVRDFLSTVNEHSQQDLVRHWYVVRTDKDVIEFRMWIEFQFDRNIAFKLTESEILLGIPVNTQNFSQVITKIEKEVDYIDRY
ncbi:hypothetical protein B0G93_101501 [Bacillus sp. V-88]|nr:hypothetical protein B0G93_101501 [Bacillus sp. V-88]SLK03533.1 hypothetical protein SAMN06295884_101501 [Bacillus sp. V-88]